MDYHGLWIKFSEENGFVVVDVSWSSDPFVFKDFIDPDGEDDREKNKEIVDVFYDLWGS